MNKVVLMGRLVKDPDCFTSKGDESILVCRYTLAVSRRRRPDEADFIGCVCFGKLADLADEYFRKGMRVCVSGYLQSGSYKNNEGETVYTLDVVVDGQEFASDRKEESKKRRR